MTKLWHSIWDTVVRWRTWIVNVVLSVMLVAPDLLQAPAIMALFPSGYQKWVIAACFLVNIWMRPRPAVRAKDPEAKA